MVKEPFKHFIERTTFIGTIARVHRGKQLKKKYIQWQQAGATGPMPNYGKQQTVIDYIKRFKPEIFIETGTYKGKMVYAVMPYIENIYTIELSGPHVERAKRRFAGYPNIKIIHGQSGEVLPELMKGIHQSCLFWLDAHYSGGSTTKGDLDSPIEQELECVLNHEKIKEHVILIDDARCFVGKGGYPTIEMLKGYVLNRQLDWTFEIKNDIIRTHNKDINDEQ
ncbi:MAG: hypothetical protein JW804_06060 [Sedimentisphaerales bacterium]|nr:hypothetical protein [Sedimentisphaerales bacterium]